MKAFNKKAKGFQTNHNQVLLPILKHYNKQNWIQKNRRYNAGNEIIINHKLLDSKERTNTTKVTWTECPVLSVAMKHEEKYPNPAASV